MANNANDVLNVARGEIGYSRWNDPLAGTKYGRWYGNDMGFGSYFAQSGVPYCAMFASWVFNQAGATCAGLPGAYCPTMLSAGKNAGRAVNKYNAQAGDVVYFDWGNDGVSDHVGIVEANNGSYLTTIEGNTDKGIVARKTRSFGTVIGVIRPNYGGSSGSTSSKPASGGQSSSSNSLVKQGQSYLKKWGYDLGPSGVDGYDGPNTRQARVRYVQHNMNAYGAGIAVDGDNGPATKAAWAKYGPVQKGSTRTYLVKAVQIALLCHGYSVGSAGIDGDCGNDTDAAIRAFQKAHGLKVDGIAGPATFNALF